MAVVLTQEEAEELLKMLKRCVLKVLNFPSLGKRADFDVTGINDKSEKFIISVNRKNKEAHKVSFVARYRQGDVRLLSLDLNPSEKHTNPEDCGGEVIEGTHLHIYREGFHDKYAIPFVIDDVGLENAFITFLQKFNVVEIPKIRTQLTAEEV